MHQLTFGDAEQQGKRTRREVFLAEMDRVVPWAALCAVIASYYPKDTGPGAGGWRRTWPTLTEVANLLHGKCGTCLAMPVTLARRNGLRSGGGRSGSRPGVAW